ncbi:hypothetical protein T190423A01A_30205 [Tenacibaculum sp. 190130A14a]|uniref:Uncharacterized protein n=1 Tax=Tenacibaculum polynesiense TaxID=3137857 RepID=A0ABM9PBX1_9FLAO
MVIQLKQNSFTKDQILLNNTNKPQYYVPHIELNTLYEVCSFTIENFFK